MRREFDEVSPRAAAKVRTSQERVEFTRWLRDTLKPGDLIHGFLMSSSTKDAMHEFSHFVDHEDCDFCAMATDGQELVLTTIVYINGERVLNNPYLRWAWIDDRSRDTTLRISGYTRLMEQRAATALV